MKITQDLRAEVLAMGANERRTLEEAAAQSEAKRAEGMAAKSAEFLEGVGKLYIDAAE